MDLAAGDAEGQARLAAFLQALQGLGWSNGGNVRIDVRWGANDAAILRRHAAELATSAPDVILSTGTASLTPLMQVTNTVPIVFTIVADPVGAGFVASLARPGGNATGFTPFEFGQSGKWLELLKEIAPAMTRAAVLRDPALTTAVAQFAAIQSVAPARGVEISPVGASDAKQIEQGLVAFLRSTSSDGLIVTASPSTTRYREVIVTLAARHRLPAIYPQKFFVTDGGLMSYSPDRLEQLRQAAGYVDRILNGANPADLPVQTPTKYELVINLKTAKALGLAMPPTLLARAEEVIE